MSRLAAADLAAATNVAVYTAPASRRVTLSLSVCNRTVSDTVVRVALTTGGVPGNSDWLDYDMALPGNESYERSGIILSSGQVLYVYAAAAGCSAVVWGIEEVVV